MAHKGAAVAEDMNLATPFDPQQYDWPALRFRLLPLGPHWRAAQRQSGAQGTFCLIACKQVARQAAGIYAQHDGTAVTVGQGDERFGQRLRAGAGQESNSRAGTLVK